jgi:hypothetical protein
MVIGKIGLFVLFLFCFNSAVVEQGYGRKDADILIGQKFQPVSQEQSNTNYYITTSGSSSGSSCTQSSPCSNVTSLLAFIVSSGGDVYIDSGTYNISTGSDYSNVNLSLFGMSGIDGGSVDINDIETYPILVSTCSSTYVFRAYSTCRITAKYIRFYFSEPAYDYQRFFGSLTLIILIILIILI